MLEEVDLGVTAQRLTDDPAGGEGRRYLVEPRLERRAPLDTLVDDYLAKPERVGYPPTHG
jgi:hypothetical protein